MSRFIGHVPVSEPFDGEAWVRAENEARLMARRRGVKIERLQRVDDEDGKRVRVVGKTRNRGNAKP